MHLNSEVDFQVEQIRMKIRWLSACWAALSSGAGAGRIRGFPGGSAFNNGPTNPLCVQYALCHTCNWDPQLYHPGTVEHWPPAAFPQCTPRHIILRHHIELTAPLTSAHSLFNSLPIKVGSYSVPGGWCLWLKAHHTYHVNQSSVNVLGKFRLFLHNTKTVCPKKCLEKLLLERASVMHTPLYS